MRAAADGKGPPKLTPADIQKLTYLPLRRQGESLLRRRAFSHTDVSCEAFA